MAPKRAANPAEAEREEGRQACRPGGGKEKASRSRAAEVQRRFPSADARQERAYRQVCVHVGEGH